MIPARESAPFTTKHATASILIQHSELFRGVSVIVPVYNGSATVAELALRVEEVMNAAELPFEVIFVNDGSSDDSWSTLQRLAEEHSYVRAIDLMRNYGQHNAILCGLRVARFDVSVTMDDDLQNPPEEIPKLLTELDAGFDVVYGVPSIQQHGLSRNLASEITKIALSGAMGASAARNASAFRALRTRLRDGFLSYQGPWVFIDALLTWSTNRFGSVRVRHEARKLGRSGYNLYRLLKHGMNMMTGFSALPLQVASLVGFTFTLFGFVLLVYVLVRFFMYGHAVPGFSFLASMIAIFSGAQMFAIGIIGEYLARMHFRSMGQPAAAIRQILEHGRE
jgi:undecaprenyl-phosphate 4-deoxy-4-formamido-L-arabinose transferase